MAIMRMPQPHATQANATYTLRHAYMLLIIACVAYSLLVYMRLPNSWSFSQHFINYEFGVIKRGLIGTVLKLFSYTLSYEFVVVLSMVVLAVELCLFLWLGRAMAKTAFLCLSAVVFYTSHALGSHIHSVAYFDHYLILFGLYILFAPRRQMRFAMPVVCIIGMLVHEMFLLIGGHCILLRILMLRHETASHTRRYEFSSAAICLTTMLIICVLMMLTPLFITHEGTVARMFESAAARTQYPIMYDVFSPVMWQLDQNITQNIWNRKDVWLSLSFPIMRHQPIIITALFFVVLNAAIISRQTAYFFPAILRIILLAVSCLAPMALILIAWDYGRFFSLSVLLGFITYLKLVHSEEGMIIMPRLWRIVLALMAVAVMGYNYFTIPVLMDNRVPASYPFTEQFKGLANALKGELHPHGVKY